MAESRHRMPADGLRANAGLQWPIRAGGTGEPTHGVETIMIPVIHTSAGPVRAISFATEAGSLKGFAIMPGNYVLEAVYRNNQWHAVRRVDPYLFTGFCA